jgi:peptide/nickel transport system permease protein
VTLAAWFALLAAFVLAGWAVGALRRRTARHEAGRRFFRHPSAAWGVGVLAFFVIVALAAPVVTSFDPREQLDIVRLKSRPPSWSNILGTDVYSRDLWSRVAYGARISLSVGALGMLVAITLGTVVGAVAGYYRRWVDAVLMRAVDVGLSLPRIFVLLIAIALFGQLPLAVLVLVIGFTSWFGTSRLVRAEVLSVRERDFVAAARAVGAGGARVIFRHVLPNAAAPIIVSAALSIGNVLLLEAALSFLGIGVRPPAPSWGNIIADGAPYLATAPWTTLFPGLAIALVVMALNAVGDALRDTLDPRQEAT